MRRVLPLVRTYGFDAIVIAAAIAGVLDVALRDAGGREPQASLWVTGPAIAAMVLALLGRRQWPFGAPAAVWLIGAAGSFIDGRLMVFGQTPFAAGMAAAFLLGNLGDGVQARSGLAIVVGAAAIIVYRDPNYSTGNLVVVPAVFAIVWVAGLALRKRLVESETSEAAALRLAQERAEGARRAVADERTRIARELHDIVGHSVSVMTVQAAGVRRLLRPEQEKEREALAAVEQTGREAMAEMRRLVEVLRDPADIAQLEPQPRLDDISKLVEQARATGLVVQLTIEGVPVRLPAGIDLTAYRLVQEGLTNTIRHARASQAEVRVRYSESHVEVEVHDDGAGQTNGHEPGGHGLVGMRERVSVYGGELEAGPCAEGGFRLRARLPVKA